MEEINGYSYTEVLTDDSSMDPTAGRRMMMMLWPHPPKQQSLTAGRERRTNERDQTTRQTLTICKHNTLGLLGGAQIQVYMERGNAKRDCTEIPIQWNTDTR